MNDKNKTLNDLKNRREAVLMKKAELTARLKSAQDQYREITEEIKQKYNIEPSELSDLISEKEREFDQLSQELASAITKAESLLQGLNS